MTLCAPHTGDTATAPVAARVADRLLGLVDDPGTATVGRAVDWQGPLRVPLADEHAVQAACGIMHVHGRAAGRPDWASACAPASARPRAPPDRTCGN
ncbi:hypothetical protein [Streptomyces sp. NPDC006739]|uniref:hypothetical protein n=1 Tax=Streptomyces sp. NPDC006739 TaxID=3364763 RepID=UPI0036AAC453